MRNGNRRRGNKGETYNRSLHVLARMRRTGTSLTAAAREERIDPRTVRKHLRADLHWDGGVAETAEIARVGRAHHNVRANTAGLIRRSLDLAHHDGHDREDHDDLDGDGEDADGGADRSVQDVADDKLVHLDDWMRQGLSRWKEQGNKWG